jgi:hypothetical protein
MLVIDMLPAGKGDCLWIEYGKGTAVRRLLVDGGIPGTADVIRERIEGMAPAICRFELLVVTHIDLDHIGGVLDLLQNPPPNLEVCEVWFNGWRHLESLGLLGAGRGRNWEQGGQDDIGILGAKQGERLSAEIAARGYLWNETFGGGPIMIGEDGTLPYHNLDGDLRLTLLSPTRKRLEGLRQAWEKELRKAGWKPGEVLERLGEERTEEGEDEGILGPAPDLEALARSVSKEDTSKANGSSLALLLEYDKKRCLLAGDAYARDVTESVGRLAEKKGEDVLEVHALKLSHHGGRKNTSADLIRSLICPRFLFSTNGVQHQHPDPESVARAIVYGQRPGFNYRTEQTEIWDDVRLFRKHKYALEYPPDDEEGLRVEL